MLQEVESYLTKHNIKFILHPHPAVFTANEAEVYCKSIPGLHCKNLFMKNKATNDFFLIVMPAIKRLDIASLQTKLEIKKLCFASADELKSVLNLTPGSVSPLGLINDKDHVTNLIIDQESYGASIVSFHPNENTASLEVPIDSFHRLIDSFQNKKKILAL